MIKAAFNKNDKYSLYMGILLWCIFLVKFFFVVFTADQGIDYIDDGTYMLWFKYPEMDPNPFYYHHKIILGLFGWIDWNVISLRFLKIATDITIAIVISMTAWKFLPVARQTWKNFLFLSGMCLLGFFSTTYSRVFYEGDMTYLLVSLSVCFLLLFILHERKTTKLAFLFLAGCIIALQFFSKFSSSILLIGIALVAIIVFSRRNISFLIFFLGVFSGAGFFFLITGYMPQEWLREYKQGYDFVVGPEKGNIFLIIIDYVFATGILAILSVTPLLCYFLLNAALKLQDRFTKSLLFSAVILLCGMLYYFLFPYEYFEAQYVIINSLVRHWYYPLGAILLFMLVEYRQGLTQHKILSFVTLFSLAPLITAAGTGSILNVALSAYTIPIYGLLGFLLVQSTGYFAFAFLATGVSVFGFIFYQVQYPFGQIAPQYAQTFPVKGPNETIYLDEANAKFVSSVQEILQSEKVKMPYPIVALHNLAGLVYLSGGYSPFTPVYFHATWFNGEQMGERAHIHGMNINNLKRTEAFEDQLPIFFIDVRNDSIIKHYLSYTNYDLQNDYQKPIFVMNPLLKYEHKLLNNSQSAEMAIYIPKTIK